MTGLPPPNVLSYEGQVVVPCIIRPFPPTTANHQFDVPTIWIDPVHKIPYIIVAKPQNVADWIAFGGGGIITETLTGNSGGPVSPTANNINVLGDGTSVTVSGNPGTSTLTVAATGAVATVYTEDSGTAVPSAGNLHVVGGTGVTTSGSGSTITINAGASVPLIFNANTGSATPAANTINILGGTGANTVGSGSTITINATAFETAYINVTHAMSPYTVLTTDQYLSVDCSGGVVTLNFPNAPVVNHIWTVKDRTGNAAASNITITTPGGTVTFDGGTTYTINTNYEAINILANATPTYEVF